MNQINELIGGPLLRTREIEPMPGRKIILNEFSTTKRMTLIEERDALTDNDSSTALELNLHAAKVVAQSILGPDKEVTDDDATECLDLFGLDLIDELYGKAVSFNGLDNDKQEEARKNS